MREPSNFCETKKQVYLKEFLSNFDVSLLHFYNRPNEWYNINDTL